MNSCKIFAIAVLIFACNCLADTFTDLQTGESFNGYPTSKKRGKETQVRIEKRSPKYIDLDQYKVEYNYLGRKNDVYIITIKDSLQLVAEAKAFEQTIDLAVNQGVYFILIEIDSPGARPDLAERLSKKLAQTDSCQTVAFLTGGQWGGALGQSSLIAMSCDKVYMAKTTKLGGESGYKRDVYTTGQIEMDYAAAVDANMLSQWQDYLSKDIGQLAKPQILIDAMLDPNIEVIEVNDNGKFILTDKQSKDPNQIFVRIFSDRGKILTLDAEQAKKYGACDGFAESREQLISILQADKVRQVRDTRMRRSRTAFERVLRSLSRNYTTIVNLRDRANAITKDIDAIEQQVRSSNSMFLNERYGIVGRNLNRRSSLGINLDSWASILANHDNLVDELVFVLGNLIKEHTRAIRITDKYEDLSYFNDKLTKSLDLARTDYQSALSRPYFSD